MKRLAVVGVVLALVVPAAGAAAPPDVKAIAAARERAALRKAEKLLLSVKLPAGATRLSHIPIHDLGMTTREAGVSIDTMSAERYGFWRVRQSVAFVMEFAAAHPVWGLTANGGGTLQDGSQYQPFYGRGSPMQRVVAVSAVRARGWTFIRVDASTAWIYPRSPEEALPAGVREIDIRGGGVSRHLTDPARVGRVVHWFGALSVTPPHSYTVSCNGPGPITTESFLFRSASGKVLARATGPLGASACDPIQFTVGGKEQTPLIDATASKDAFVARVERMLGVCFGAGPSGGRRPTPVCNKQWAEEEGAKLLRQFRPPSGATRIRQPMGYGGVVRNPGAPFGEFVDHVHFWRVPEKLSQVLGYVEGQAPHGFTGAGDVNGPDEPQYSRHLEFSSPTGTRILVVGLQQTPAGTTILRVDAQVVWVYPRSPKEVVPAGVSEIDVNGANFARRVRNTAKVGKIVRWFDRLPIWPPGVGAMPCGPSGPTFTVVFRSRTRGRVAAAQLSEGRAGGCAPITFAIRGKQQTPLIDNARGATFAGRLRHLLGVKLTNSPNGPNGPVGPSGPKGPTG